MATDQNPKPARFRRDTGYLTTQQGVRVDHTDDSLTVGERGPTLLEDFHAREKITHFDHERIPERVVHARGAGAYGYFEPYDDWLADYTAAKVRIWKLPSVISLTRFATRSAPPNSVSRLFGQLAARRHWMLGCDCAMAGAATVEAATPAAALFRNDLRSILPPGN